MKIFILCLCTIFSQFTNAQTYVYHFVPGNLPLVTSRPTQPSSLQIISDPVETTIPTGVEHCLSWGMGPLTKDVGGGTFGTFTGFYPPVGNQIQSTMTDSGFQNFGDTRGIYIATPNRPLTASTAVLGIQCGQYYGKAKAFYPWNYGQNSILKHGLTVALPYAYFSLGQSNPANLCKENNPSTNNQKYTVTTYLRVTERGDTWKDPIQTNKGFWLQVILADGRGSTIFNNTNGQNTGYYTAIDPFTKRPYVDIQFGTQSGFISVNSATFQTGSWTTPTYFEYTINRTQIASIVALANSMVPTAEAITTNPDNLMVFAAGMNPEVSVCPGDLAVLGMTLKNQYVRTEH